jgi:hypothetical protein
MTEKNSNLFVTFRQEKVLRLLRAFEITELLQLRLKFIFKVKESTFIILCRINSLLGNDLVNTFPREQTHATVGRLLLGNGSVNTSKIIRDNIWRWFTLDLPQGYIGWSSKGAVSYQKFRKFWRWQSKVIEKELQERNQAVQRRLHVWFEVTVILL